MSWIDRLTNVLRHRDLNPEIDEELQFHIDSRIRDGIAAGLTPEAARRDALERFGGRMGIREQTRDANILVRLETIGQDSGLRLGASASDPPSRSARCSRWRSESRQHHNPHGRPERAASAAALSRLGESVAI